LFYFILNLCELIYKDNEEEKTNKERTSMKGLCFQKLTLACLATSYKD